jgi:YYY domain-containing protein
MLGELHSENLAIPLVLVVIGLALAFWRLPRGAVKLQRGTMPLALATALVLGAASVTQAWYAPALLALLAFVIISRGYADSGRLDRSTLANASVLILFVGALSVVLFLPFYRTSFSSFGGIILVEDAASRPHHFLYMWLPLGWPAAALAAGAISRGGRTLPLAASAAATATAVVGLWAVAMLLDRGPGSLLDAVAGRASNASWLSVLVIGGLLFAAVLALLQHLTAAEPERRRDERAFALGLVALAALLLVGIEFFWVDDNVVPATGHFILGNYGFNSIIKANFMAWFLLSIAGAFAFHELACMRPSRPRLNAVRWGALAGATLLIALGLVYTVTSTFHSTDRFRQPRHLDLLWQTRASQPGEYEAIVWLDENVKGAPVVLESTGDSYGPFGRVSAATGLPTVLGWQSHEAHWRGGREPQAGRPEAVERIYKTTDASEAKALLQQYDVEFVYVGALERQTYGEEGLGKFAAFMDVAFQGQDVTIYRVREG